MAGTRLLVHAVFLVQIFGLVLVSLYVGSIHRRDDDDGVGVGFGFGTSASGSGMLVDRRGAASYLPAAERILDEAEERMTSASKKALSSDGVASEEAAAEMKEGTEEGRRTRSARTRRVLLRLRDAAAPPHPSSSCSASEEDESSSSSCSASSEESPTSDTLVRYILDAVNDSAESMRERRLSAAEEDEADRRPVDVVAVAAASSSASLVGSADGAGVLRRCDDLTANDAAAFSYHDDYGNPDDGADEHDEEDPPFVVDALLAWGCTDDESAMTGGDGGEDDGDAGVRVEVDSATGAVLVRIRGAPPPTSGGGDGGAKEQAELIAGALRGLAEHIFQSSEDSVLFYTSSLKTAEEAPPTKEEGAPPPPLCRSVRLTAIDEDPSSWSFAPSLRPHDHHSELGRALHQSYVSNLKPLLRSISSTAGRGTAVTPLAATLRTVAYGSLSDGSKTLGGGDGKVADPPRVRDFAKDHREILSETRRFGGEDEAEGRRRCTPLDLVVYVPSRENVPLHVKDDAAVARGGAYGSAFAVATKYGNGGEVAVAIANLQAKVSSSSSSEHSSNNTFANEEEREEEERLRLDYEGAVNEALSYLSARVARLAGLRSPQSSTSASSPTVTAIPADLSSSSGRKSSVPVTVHPPPPGTLSRSDRDALLASRFRAALASASEDLRSTLNVLGSHHRTKLTPNGGERLQRCAELLLSAASSYSPNSAPAASALRDAVRASRCASELSSDGDFAEEYLYFPREHYVAVLSPLILPLVLPLVVGFGREWKRYKKLTAAIAAEGVGKEDGDGNGDEGGTK